jgi:hypothetical protein
MSADDMTIRRDELALIHGSRTYEASTALMKAAIDTMIEIENGRTR